MVNRNASLPYLDVKVIRNENGRLNTNWYQKPSAAGKVINFLSTHPNQQKINVAFNLFFRILSISNECYHKENIDAAFEILRANNYPTKIIQQQLYRAKQKIITTHTTTTAQYTPTQTTETDDNNETEKIYRGITFIPGISEPIAKIVKSFKNNLTISFKPTIQLRSTTFSKLKERIELLDKTKVVYKIPCKGKLNADGKCTEKCDKCYVGHTKNPLKARKRTHELSIKSSSYGNTALKTHALTQNHTPDFENISVLASVSHYNKRLTQETLHILDQNTYNVRTDCQQLSASYCG